MIHIPHIVALVLFLFFLSKVAKENFWILPCQCFPKSQVKKKKKKFLKVTKLQIIVEPCWISPNICLLFRWQIALRISLRTCSLSSSTQLNANEIWDCWVFYPFLLNSVAAQVHHSTFVHNAWQTAETQMCTKKKKKELYNII